jgi:hypothetical protein
MVDLTRDSGRVELRSSSKTGDPDSYPDFRKQQTGMHVFTSTVKFL